MLKTKLFPIVLAILVMAAASSASVADHRHHGRHFGGGYHGFHGHPGFSFYFGVPLFPRPYYSYPYYPYYPPAVMTVPSSPPVYIERSPPPVAQQYPAGYWYYCGNPEGYYPYIQDCPSGWRQVDPVPPR